MVLIGIDPHKASHTAVAIDADEHPVCQVRVRADRRQVERLLDWAAAFEQRTWAVESAAGLGYLLSQQLLAAGEHVVDVPATLAAKVRLLTSGSPGKSDPNDALSTAVAALRHPHLRVVTPDDHAAVLRILADRNHDLGRLRTQAVCRLHAVLCTLVPGGLTRRLSAKRAGQMLARIRPVTAVEVQRKQLAADLLADVRRLDRDIAATKARIRTAVAASATTVTDVYGVGPVVAALLIGHTGDVRRFPSAGHYASYNATAPIEASFAEADAYVRDAAPATGTLLQPSKTCRYAAASATDIWHAATDECPRFRLGHCGPRGPRRSRTPPATSGRGQQRQRTAAT